MTTTTTPRAIRATPMTITEACRAKPGRTVHRINNARRERKLGIETPGADGHGQARRRVLPGVELSAYSAGAQAVGVDRRRHVGGNAERVLESNTDG